MKVGYSKTFPNLANGQWVKVWAEEDQPGTIEDARKTWYAIKKEVENFYYESTKADEKKFEAVKITPEGKTYIGDQIKSCKELKVLESYKMIVKGKPELEEIYNNRLKELT